MRKRCVLISHSLCTNQQAIHREWNRMEFSITNIPSKFTRISTRGRPCLPLRRPVVEEVAGLHISVNDAVRVYVPERLQ